MSELISYANEPKLIFQYESKSITPVNDYEVVLSKELRKKAEQELRETDEIREFAIEAFRNWAMQNERIIKTRLDTAWLLKYLRFRKYSLPLAQEAMERHLVLRQGSHGLKYFHWEMDVMRPSVKAVFDQQ